ncbi:MAG: hypothetical protein IMW98_03485 [Firmicutes bacterium]|nr:hypothetical protein [Bacillota bacterium]
MTVDLSGVPEPHLVLGAELACKAADVLTERPACEAFFGAVALALAEEWESRTSYGISARRIVPLAMLTEMTEVELTFVARLLARWRDGAPCQELATVFNLLAGELVDEQRRRPDEWARALAVLEYGPEAAAELWNDTTAGELVQAAEWEPDDDAPSADVVK